MKVFISDLDGSLLDHCFQDDAAIDECVERVLASGNDFVVATGRTLYGIQQLNIYRHPIYFIIMNGAMILDRKKQILYKKTIDTNIVNAIVKRYPSDSIEYITQDKNYLAISKAEYLDRYGKWDIWKKKMLGNGNDVNLHYLLSHMVFDAHIDDIAQDVVKINILEMNPEQYIEKNAYIAQFHEIVDQPFDTCVLEITASNVTKDNAIKKLMEVTGWKDSELYVFGDGDNDCGMLADFQHSYALENGSAKAKRSAAYTIGNCASKAVLHQIDHLLQMENCYSLPIRRQGK